MTFSSPSFPIIVYKNHLHFNNILMEWKGYGIVHLTVYIVKRDYLLLWLD